MWRTVSGYDNPVDFVAVVIDYKTVVNSVCLGVKNRKIFFERSEHFFQNFKSITA